MMSEAKVKESIMEFLYAAEQSKSRDEQDIWLSRAGAFLLVLRGRLIE